MLVTAVTSPLTLVPWLPSGVRVNMDEVSLRLTSLSVVVVKAVEGSAFSSENSAVVVAAEVDMSGTLVVGGTELVVEGTEVMSIVVLVTMSPAVLAVSLVVTAVAGIKQLYFVLCHNWEAPLVSCSCTWLFLLIYDPLQSQGEKELGTPTL